MSEYKSWLRYVKGRHTCNVYIRLRDSFQHLWAVYNLNICKGYNLENGLAPVIPYYNIQWAQNCTEEHNDSRTQIKSFDPFAVWPDQSTSHIVDISYLCTEDYNQSTYIVFLFINFGSSSLAKLNLLVIPRGSIPFKSQLTLHQFMLQLLILTVLS